VLSTKVKSKVVPVNVTMVYGGVGVQLHPTALDGGEFPASCPAILPPKNEHSLATEYGAELVPKLEDTLEK
jgi:hypothetical protein